MGSKSFVKGMFFAAAFWRNESSPRMRRRRFGEGVWLYLSQYWLPGNPRATHKGMFVVSHCNEITSKGAWGEGKPKKNIGGFQVVLEPIKNISRIAR